MPDLAFSGVLRCSSFPWNRTVLLGLYAPKARPLIIFPVLFFLFFSFKKTLKIDFTMISQHRLFKNASTLVLGRQVVCRSGLLNRVAQNARLIPCHQPLEVQFPRRFLVTSFVGLRNPSKYGIAWHDMHACMDERARPAVPLSTVVRLVDNKG